jgi:predicted permease
MFRLAGDLSRDLRYAVRSMRDNPGLTAVAVLTLALGIGANTTIFGFLNEGLLRPVPHATDPDRLVQLRRQLEGRQTEGFSHLAYVDYRDRARSFSGLMGYRGADLLLGAGGRPVEIKGGIVTGNFFQVLGLGPAMGRLLGPDDDRTPGAHPVAVLSYALWKTRFGADPGAIGRPIVLNGFPFLVIGVAPDGFQSVEVGEREDLWIPLAMEKQARPSFPTLNDRVFASLSVVGRLRPGVSLEQAQAELNVLAPHLEDLHQGKRPRVLVAAGIRLAPEWRGAVLELWRVLGAMVGLVLLVACANVANLMLARATARRREIAVRLAIGAGRARLLRQLLTESVLLALMGGLAGLAVAFGGGELLRRFIPEVDFATDRRMLGFTLAVSLASGILFGLAPALASVRLDLVSSLKGAAAGRGDSRARLRQALVVAQVALSLVVMVVAGLFVRTLGKLQAVDPGFDRRGVFFVQFGLRATGYSQARGQALYAGLVERVAALGEVSSVSLANTLPPGWMWTWEIEARTGALGAKLAVGYNVVAERYFETLGIPLTDGRVFGPADAGGAPRVAIVNESLARRLWPGERAVGKSFRRVGGFGPQPFTEVIGVARDGKYANLAEKPRPFVYLPLAQNYQSEMKLVVRAAGGTASAIAAVRDQVAAADPNLPFPKLVTMDQHIAGSMNDQRMNATLIGIFGLLALLLSSVGVYAVTSYAVERRTAEIGIRLALGARPVDVLRAVLGNAMALTGIGLLAGALLALAMIPLVKAELYGVGAADPLSFAAAALVLASVTLVAAYLPARRVLRIDPMSALRYE